VLIGKSINMSRVYSSNTITIGHLNLGGDQPVRIQSMANTDTNDVEGSIDQCRKMIRAGAELVRLTTQGRRELDSLRQIRMLLREEGIDTPVVADIHFKPGLALEAVQVVDKIRINPGNYLGGQTVESLLPQLLDACKQHHTTIRIGVNHGSLSESILNDYGDTPAGMVESAMRFLRICREKDFNNVVVSMKSSNPVVMVQSVRLLVNQMIQEKLSCPLHLGVTEAGDGLEGRIKSTVGLAPLLLEGLGDTIRVSLTEPPEAELPIARTITDLFPKPAHLPYDPFHGLAWNPFSFERRNSRVIEGVGGGSFVKIISPTPPQRGIDLLPDQVNTRFISFYDWKNDPSVLDKSDCFLLLEQDNQPIQEIKQQLNEFCTLDRSTPVIFKCVSQIEEAKLFRLHLAGTLGSLLVDGCLDAVWVENKFHEEGMINDTLLMILQATGSRISRTEYIACPSCGRTHFDILARLKEVRKATSHLTTLKIGVMGCIVNGPGEMADAHYGYVGAGPGRVSLYKGRDPRIKNIPENEALAELIRLIKEEGDWVDP